MLGNMYALFVERKMEHNTTSQHAKIANGSIFIHIYIFFSVTDHEHLRTNVV